MHIEVYKKCSDVIFPYFWGQPPKKSSKVLFKFDFFLVASIIVLGTQIQNINMSPSKLIIKTIAQKVMVDYDFGCRFHDLNIF